MWQKTRKVGEPTTPDPFFGASGGAKAKQALAAGKAALSKIDAVAEDAKRQQAEAQEQARRQVASRCGC